MFYYTNLVKQFFLIRKDTEIRTIPDETDILILLKKNYNFYEVATFKAKKASLIWPESVIKLKKSNISQT